ncbi:Hypothetical predicted protein [Octopus vulgaris]|uniref:Uncharacterized protein n=1 Tax=Octopus vulgaris TaxID=6645 RepID=A0AA36FIH3_OCTVU|nr:Hypothetical predicted protein [Octopus vulgaris]
MSYHDRRRNRSSRVNPSQLYKMILVAIRTTITGIVEFLRSSLNKKEVLDLGKRSQSLWPRVQEHVGFNKTCALPRLSLTLATTRKNIKRDPIRKSYDKMQIFVAYQYYI